MVADDPSQDIVLDDPGGKIEDDGPQTGHNADQDCQAEQAGLDADPALRQQEKLGKEAKPVARYWS